MHNVTTTLHECLHCKGKGTCRNAENGTSCAACVKLNDLKASRLGSNAQQSISQYESHHKNKIISLSNFELIEHMDMLGMTAQPTVGI